jgi:hypothetical protein
VSLALSDWYPTLTDIGVTYTEESLYVKWLSYVVFEILFDDSGFKETRDISRVDIKIQMRNVDIGVERLKSPIR